MDGEDVGLLEVGGENGSEENSGAAVAEVDSGDVAEVVEDGTTETTESTEESTGDGRAIPAAAKAHLAELKKVNPSLEKFFRGEVYAAKEARSLGPIPELRETMQTVELYGGREGLTQMAESVEANKLLEQGFERGDPKVIDGWAQDFPEGFKKLVVPAFDKLAQLDPQYYEKAGSTIATKFLGQYGVFDAMSQIGEALGANKPEDAFRLYNDLVKKVFAPMRSLASQPTVDTSRDSELSEREKQLNQRDEELFMSGIRGRVNNEMTLHVNKILKTLLGNRTLTVPQNNKLRKDINTEIATMVNSNPDYQRRYTALQKSRNEELFFSHVTSNGKAKALEAAKKVLRESGFASAPRQQTTTKQTVTPQPKGPQAVNGRPAIPDVDFTRTDKAQFIGMREHGKAWLKSGKQVTW